MLLNEFSYFKTSIIVLLLIRTLDSMHLNLVVVAMYRISNGLVLSEIPQWIHSCFCYWLVFYDDEIIIFKPRVCQC